MIIKNNIKEIVSAEIGGRSMPLADSNIINIAEKIGDCFFKKYGIDIDNMLGSKFYKINTAGELKFAIDDAREFTSDVKEMKAYLRDNYKIEMKLESKEILFKHPQGFEYIKGHVLGKEYSGAGIYSYFLEKRGKSRARNKVTSIDRKNKAKVKFEGISMER